MYEYAVTSTMIVLAEKKKPNYNEDGVDIVIDKGLFSMYQQRKILIGRTLSKSM